MAFALPACKTHSERFSASHRSVPSVPKKPSKLQGQARRGARKTSRALDWSRKGVGLVMVGWVGYGCGWFWLVGFGLLPGSGSLVFPRLPRLEERWPRAAGASLLREDDLVDQLAAHDLPVHPTSQKRLYTRMSSLDTTQALNAYWGSTSHAHDSYDLQTPETLEP